ncbi:DUF72 domain-containing protein [Bacillus sp. FJAT-44742]|uniref:DUF72 domain-containing protein n=1 Tax=Bacillus sp. FJAT-44742 TaxID=2014005 RepID=UPI000C244FB5|nr:DUF72 domain-containing protein [Bacillus sp. FJAT-44742]
MIYVGVTGWGDHDTLYSKGTRPGEKLKEYGSHFPTVEVDASFYAVQPQRNYEKWVRETPDNFRFVVKAYQGMTGHERKEIPFASKEEMYEAYLESLGPVIESGKLAMVLCQFPPWFDCNKENVEFLRYTKDKLGTLPAALEFRNNTWFSPEYYNKTLEFMEREEWIHSICDEPQIGEASVPTVLHPTHSEKTLIRLHGRNHEAWKKPAKGDKWRETRYLYNYSRNELNEWLENIDKIKDTTKDIYMLFNNNSGGDAAPNAKSFLELAGISYEGLNPKQLSLFEDHKESGKSP